MMCDSCKELARRQVIFDSVRARPPKHTRKKKPHCEYPETCTCRHRPVKDGYVQRDGVG